MNKVMLTGNLCRDTELRQTQAGTEVANNSIAVQRDFKNSNGEYESDFINIVVWGSSASYLHKYGKKGDRVEIVGRWQARKYQDSNGTQQYAHECVAENIRVFSNKKDNKKPAFEQVDGTGLPF